MKSLLNRNFGNVYQCTYVCKNLFKDASLSAVPLVSTGGVKHITIYKKNKYETIYINFLT